MMLNSNANKFEHALIVESPSIYQAVDTVLDNLKTWILKHFQNHKFPVLFF